MKKAIIAFILIFSFIAIFGHVSAKIVKAENVKPTRYERIIPGSPFYKIKRLWEKFVLATKKGDDYNAYYGRLVEKRLNELVRIVEEDRLAYTEEASSRYTTFLQKFLLMNKDKKVSGEIVDNLRGQQAVLEKLRDHFSANSAQWLLLQQSLDTLKVALSSIN